MISQYSKNDFRFELKKSGITGILDPSRYSKNNAQWTEAQEHRNSLILYRQNLSESI
jgi:hypothetical protein